MQELSGINRREMLRYLAAGSAAAGLAALGRPAWAKPSATLQLRVGSYMVDLEEG